MSAKPSKAEQYRAFARAYAEPTSPTFQNASASYRLLHPEATAQAVEKAVGRWLKHPVVTAAVAAMQVTAAAVAGRTMTEYVEKCIENEAFLLERGEKGDAQAAVMYAKLAGTALGFLVQRTKDETPKPPEGDALDTVERFLAAAARLQRITQPNPLPALTASAGSGPIADADYTITEEVHESAVPEHAAPQHAAAEAAE